MLSRFIPEHALRSLIAAVTLLLGTLLPGATSVAAAAASQAILPFGATTWKALADAPSRPLAVVFSTTDCSHCPKVIDAVSAAIRKSRSKAQLIVVVMDGAGQESSLTQNPHYRDVRSLYVFDGDDMALRHTVNPDWRGLTPYVALLPVKGEARFYTGSPPAAAMAAFLRP
jgi:hypothetical protein